VSKLDFAYWDAVPEGPPEYLPADVYEMHIALVQKLESLGWHSYFTIEHQNRPGANITSPSVYLTAVARATSTIRIGTMMWQLPFHHPLRLAQEVAMLDHLSKGRVEFGSGIGVHEHEFIRWGVDYYQRAAISEEAIEIIKRAWTQPEVTFDGKYFHFEEALPNPQPYQKPHPPIWAAVHSDDSMIFAARHNYNVAQNLDTDDVVARKFDLYRETWKECGHPGPLPRIFLQRTVHIAETDEKAHEQARRYIGAATERRIGGGPIAKTRVGWGSNVRGMGRDSERPDDLERGKTMEQSQTSYEFNIENGLAIVGSPDTVVQKLQEGQKKIGYDLFCTSFIGRLPKDEFETALELWGKEVIPAFK
jgi:alkanesulfonate monooxygenase SsuD/methylene tetrahydromethanopterin reductase-like flavin-dependent oxidoreductase (luciferase family)